jgi:autotransporter-associated beta strand protein
VVLTGTNIYTGPTQVNAGTLEIDGSISPSSGVTVGGATASGSPILSGIGTIAGTVTLSGARRRGRHPESRYGGRDRHADGRQH